MAEEVEMEVEADDTEESVLVEFDIASYPSDYPLGVLHQMWKDGELEIPDFQRNFVWTIQQSSQLIESFLLGLPVPQLFFYISDDHKNLVIDGQQRLLSVVFFLEGYFGFENLQGRRQVFRLTGLDERSPFIKKTFSELSESNQRKLRGVVLRVINIRQLTPEGKNTSIYHIFERLNTGGTPLRPQEIRNCVFSGDFAHKLRSLNALPSWRQLIARQTISKNQRDIEMILRVFSFCNDWKRYEKPMKEFLNKSMKEHRAGDTKKAKDFVNKFDLVCQRLLSELPDRPFHVRGPINLAALDSILSTCVESYPKWPSDLEKRYMELVGDNTFRDLMFFSTSDTERVGQRMAMARKKLMS